MTNLGEGEYYEVMYNTCYGGFMLPTEFLEQVFETYPPESEVGKDLWKPEKYAHFLQNGDIPSPEWNNYYQIIEKAPFKAGYFKVTSNSMHKDKDGAFKAWSRKCSDYVTKDDKTYYFLSEIPSDYIWRESPHVIALGKAFGLFGEPGAAEAARAVGKRVITELALAKIPIGYTFHIHEYDGKESVEEEFPYRTVIHELLSHIKSPDDTKLGPLTKKLISGELKVTFI